MNLKSFKVYSQTLTQTLRDCHYCEERKLDFVEFFEISVAIHIVAGRESLKLYSQTEVKDLC